MRIKGIGDFILYFTGLFGSAIMLIAGVDNLL